jgi:hypothetical protein
VFFPFPSLTVSIDSSAISPGVVPENRTRLASPIGAKITVCGVPKPAKRAWSFSPWRASSGITCPPRYFLSPVWARSGHPDSAPTGLKIFWFPQTLPRLARHGPNDHATPWLNTLRGPASASNQSPCHGPSGTASRYFNANASLPFSAFAPAPRGCNRLGYRSRRPASRTKWPRV